MAPICDEGCKVFRVEVRADVEERGRRSAAETVEMIGMRCQPLVKEVPVLVEMARFQ